jgi:streptomycin 6-kinase
LLVTSAPTVLLHGDLHQDNILQDGDEWLVIDPKGVIGEDAYEVGAFIRNPIEMLISSEKVLDMLRYRVKYFSDELFIPSQRIKDWSFVQAVLAWAWALEDGLESQIWEKIAEVLNKL